MNAEVMADRIEHIAVMVSNEKIATDIHWILQSVPGSKFWLSRNSQFTEQWEIYS